MSWFWQPIVPPAASSASYTLAGAVTYTLTPAAAFDFNNESVLAGAVTYTLTPAAAFDFNNESVLAGAVTYTLAPAAAFDFNNESVLTGAVDYTMTPAASFAFEPFAVPVPTPFLGATFEVAHVEQYKPRTRKPPKRKPVELTVVLPLERVIESDKNDLEDLLALLEAA